MLSVWILETWYEDGDHEINCVCETKEKAKKEQTWMLSQEEKMGKKIKKQKISEFLVL
jgi:hypothetical protein